MLYKIKYRRRFFWKTLVIAQHHLLKDLDRMDLFFPDGSVLSLSQWSRYDMRLGVDWVLATKKQMEKEAGQPIALSV